LLLKDVDNFYDVDYDPARLNCAAPDANHYVEYSPDYSRYAYYQISSQYSTGWLLIGEVSSAKYLYSADFSKYQSTRNAAGIALPPEVYWLDNHRLFFIDKNTDALYTLDIETGKARNLGSFPSAIPDFYTQEQEASPDGRYILIQSGKLGSPNLFLVDANGSGKKNLTADLKLTNLYQFDWSPDSSRFAFYAYVPQGLAVVIMLTDGTIVKTIEDAELPRWSPDGQQLLFSCNRTETKSDLCISDRDGNNIVILPVKSPNAFDSRWSPDGTKILYSSGRSRDAHVVWIETGEDVLLSRGCSNGYTLGAWSPDSQWILLDHCGPRMRLSYIGGVSRDEATTVLLCDLQAKCHDLNHGGLFVRAASWWQPTIEFVPHTVLPPSVPREGAQQFQEHFSSLDDAVWKRKGDVSIAAADIGAVVRMVGDTQTASLTNQIPAAEGDGVLVRMRFGSNARFRCGIHNDVSEGSAGWRSIALQDDPNGTSYGWLQWGLQEGSNHERITFNPIKSDTWYFLFFRIRSNNQIEASLLGPTISQVIKSISIVRDANWRNENWFFSCHVDKGIVELDDYTEIIFQTP